MTKFAALIEYDGTLYHGWQLQKDLPTVQGAMEAALARIIGAPVRVHGAGRTDAGVHAKGQRAHFTADWKGDVTDFRRALNAVSPHDITVHEITRVPDDFHARHSARRKTYRYRILNRPIRSALDRLYSWHFPQVLDIGLMNGAAAFLLGTRDFAALGAPTDGTPSTVREISEAVWETGASEGMIRFTITGSGFLRYMVRTVVGTLALVGTGKIEPLRFERIIESKDRGNAGPKAPAHGLFLMSVDY